MTARTKSIFAIGEDDEGGETKKGKSCSLQTVSSSSKASGDDHPVGLRIIARCSSSQGGPTANVVAKATMRQRRSSTGARCPSVLPELGFLKACFFCGKELSPFEDVYVYGGDQGFCSDECRFRQILINDRKEFDAYVRRRSVDAAKVFAGAGSSGQKLVIDRRRVPLSAHT